MSHKDIKEEKGVVSFCKNCKGLEPCWCDKKEYIKAWEFVYWAFKNCKGQPTLSSTHFCGTIKA